MAGLEELRAILPAWLLLAVAGGFYFVEKRLGLRYARSLIVPGHFDYQKQALLYVPQHLPDPRSAAFLAAAGKP